MELDKLHNNKRKVWENLFTILFTNLCPMRRGKICRAEGIIDLERESVDVEINGQC